MKLAIYLLFLLATAGIATAQAPTRTVTAVNRTPENPFLQKKYPQFVTTTDNNGRPFANREEVNGFPFFINGFRKSKVTLSGGRAYDNVLILLDLEHQEIHVSYGESKDIVVQDGLIQEIYMADTVSTPPAFYFFKTGFPAIDKNDAATFYQVLANGKISLLRHVKKVLVKEKNVLSGEENNEYKEYETFYIYHDNKIVPMLKGRDELMEFMKDQESKVNSFIKSQKTNFKKAASVAELINYYNSLG